MRVGKAKLMANISLTSVTNLVGNLISREWTMLCNMHHKTCPWSLTKRDISRIRNQVETGILTYVMESKQVDNVAWMFQVPQNIWLSSFIIHRLQAHQPFLVFSRFSMWNEILVCWETRNLEVLCEIRNWKWWFSLKHEARNWKQNGRSLPAVK